MKLNFTTISFSKKMVTYQIAKNRRSICNHKLLFLLNIKHTHG